MTRESPTQKRVLLAVGSRPDVRISRNNCGLAEYPDGFKVKYGLFNPGGADLIGLQRILITPQMVGKHIGRFVAIECKSDRGQTSEAQDNFLAMVLHMGGLAVVARSVADAVEALDGGLFD